MIQLTFNRIFQTLCWEKDQRLLDNYKVNVLMLGIRQLSGSPIDGRGPPVQRQDGRVVDDGAVLRVVDDLHGDELGAEGHDVEFGPHRVVRSPHIRQGIALHPPLGEFEHRRPVLLSRQR